MDTKVIAYYLPQFHEVEENNKWWGKGFTEWTNVRKAKPLFKGHNQPRVPLNDNYYNLIDKESVIWQTELCNHYGVYGLAYYHYWYKGKLLLEKPAENLLNWKDINQNFCFFWANHTWFKAVNGKKEILIKQTYGDKSDWINHYRYMEPFFLDDRYIKVDNKPMIGLYMSGDIPKVEEMIQCWNNMAKEDGFSGMYIIESLNSIDTHISSNMSNAGVIRQPNISRLKYGVPKSKVGLFAYKAIRKIKSYLHKEVYFKYKYPDIAQLEADEESNDYEIDARKVFYGQSVGWDNTSRHGKRGQVMVNANPVDFKKTLMELYKKSVEEKKEFLFINAWNEWAEGMYLEPDETYKYEYLEAIRDTVYGDN